MNRTTVGLFSLLMVSGCTCAGANAPTASLRGIVTGLDGQPIAGVAVVGPTSSATTDATGRYTMNITAGANIVRFAAPGFVTVVKNVTTVPAAPTMLHISLMAAAPAIQLSSADGGLVRGAAGAAISVPPGAFVVQGGGTIADKVSVRVTNVDPTTAAARRATSGDFSAQASGGPTMLESTGMMDIDVRSNGVRASLAPGKQMQVHMPVAQGVTNPPATMELWSFDETQGLWVSEGTATYEAATKTYVATISHMSLWNTDKPYLATCLAGRVVDENDQPLPGAHVVSSGVDYFGASDTVTGSDGAFRIAVRKSSTVDLTAQHQLGGGETRQFQSGTDGTSVPPKETDLCADAGVFKAIKDVYSSPEGTVSCDAVRGQGTSRCMEDFGTATSCFQAAGACVLTTDTGGAVTTYASGSSIRMDTSSGSGMPASSYYGADGKLCFQTLMELSGISFTVTYTLPDGRKWQLTNSGTSMTCPDGTTISLTGDQQKAAQACSPQGGGSSGAQQCTYQGPGTCTAAADCTPSGEICCAYNASVNVCTTAASCASVDGGVLP